MRKHTADAVITRALRDLDPAPRPDLTDAELEHADAAFARIVGTPQAQSFPVEPDRSRRRRNRLLVTVGLAGAAGVAAPLLLLGGSNAFASWTPKPEPLNAATAVAAAATCRNSFAVPDREERVALAERRGEWTYVLIAGPETEARCLLPNDRVGQTLRAGGFFGVYTVDPVTPPSLAANQIDETSSSQGSFDEGFVFWTEGYVGSDVTGVTVHTSSGLDIEASIAGNRFAAWWPGKQQSSHHPAEIWSYTVHLADGSAGRTN